MNKFTADRDEIDHAPTGQNAPKSSQSKDRRIKEFTNDRRTNQARRFIGVTIA